MISFGSDVTWRQSSQTNWASDVRVQVCKIPKRAFQVEVDSPLSCCKCFTTTQTRSLFWELSGGRRDGRVHTSEEWTSSELWQIPTTWTFASVRLQFVLDTERFRLLDHFLWERDSLVFPDSRSCFAGSDFVSGYLEMFAERFRFNNTVKTETTCSVMQAIFIYGSRESFGRRALCLAQKACDTWKFRAFIRDLESMPGDFKNDVTLASEIWQSKWCSLVWKSDLISRKALQCSGEWTGTD